MVKVLIAKGAGQHDNTAQTALEVAVLSAEAETKLLASIFPAKGAYSRKQYETGWI